ncbi:MAG: FtsX-like permease family protein, partial [Firmicutes bacterium]|nr:FtsX-like permease family protein [Bacillota bacterium]
LPDSFTVKAVSPDYVASIARALEHIEGINKVRYGMGSVEQIFSFTSTMREVGLALMALLGIAAVVLIAMSTRISVYARQKEIMIMKWIGSTNAFIRWPFLLEGIIIGFFGALLALCITYFAYGEVVDYLVNTLPFMTFVSAVDALSGVMSIMLLAGILMGAIGSAISVARFLDV